jgi:hypothetical protein
MTADARTQAKANYSQALIDIATTGSSYSLNGRSFSMSISDIQEQLALIGQAEAYLAGGAANSGQARIGSVRA